MPKRKRDGDVVPACDIDSGELEGYASVEVPSSSLGKAISAAEHVRVLERQRSSGSARWWCCFRISKFEMASRTKKQRWKTVKLQCKTCNAYLSANKPSVTASNHVRKSEVGGMAVYECRKEVQDRDKILTHQAGNVEDESHKECTTGSLVGASGAHP
jgi:hypothetical protein